MKNVFLKIAGLCVAGVMLFGASQAYAASGYPINKPREIDWSFAGPFGSWDLGQLQRGFKVYQNVCASCHGLKRISFRNLIELGFTEAQAKAIASEYEVTDGPNEDGEMFDRAASLTDKFPGPYANVKEAAVANNGAVPPDFSLLAKARAPERGFPTFVFDIFTMYAENGPDYIYSLLTGYTDELPEKYEISEGTHYNPYFIAGPALAMAQPLWGDDVEYDDGTEATIDQQSKDVSAFMMWAAEPTLVQRKQMGFTVMAFLIIFAGLLYMTKKKVMQDLKSA
ncbi:MAG: cytochrome c1 [Pseudomonadota bacterium]